MIHRHNFYWRGLYFLPILRHAVCRDCGKKTQRPWWPLWKES